MASQPLIGPEPLVTPPPDDLEWTSRAGHEKIREILLAWRVGHDPHDYLLAWCAVVLEGRHLFATTATGDGKTCIFYYLVIVMLYFARKGWKPPRGKIWPIHPLAVILCPVIGMEEQMATTFTRVRLNTVVLNADTMRANPALVAIAAQTTTTMLVLSPELLSGRIFESLLGTAGFIRRLALLGVDEVHLLLTWGRMFRQAFRQIGLLNARLQGSTRIVALTASILPGPEVQACCESLGLRASEMVFLRRTNLRGNLRLERRFMSLTGPAFPDLDWLVSSNLKVILFCGTIAMAFKVACDLWPLLPPGDVRATRIRIYTSLFGSSYNEETRNLLATHSSGVLVLATCALSVGIDIPFVDIVCILGIPESVNQCIQEPGRAARGDRNRIGRGIIILPHGAIDRARAMVAADAETTVRKTQSALASVDQSQTGNLTLEVAKLIIAEILEVALKEMYENPDPEPCFCTTCDGLPISGWPNPASWQKLSDVVSAAAAAPRATNGSGTRNPLSADMRVLVVSRLQKWRGKVYLTLPSDDTWYLPPHGIISDDDLNRIAENISDLRSLAQLKHFVSQLECPLIIGHEQSLLDAVHDAYDAAQLAMARKRAEANEKRKATIEAKKDVAKKDVANSLLATLNQQQAAPAEDRAAPLLLPAPYVASASTAGVPNAAQQLSSYPLRESNVPLSVHSDAVTQPKKRTRANTAKENVPLPKKKRR